MGAGTSHSQILTPHQERGFVLIDEELRNLFGGEVTMPGWHVIGSSNWKRDRISTETVAWLAFFLVVFLIGIVRGFLDLYGLWLVAISAAGIILLYLFRIRRDTVVTGHAATFAVPPVDLLEGLQAALREEGIHHDTYQNALPDGIAMVVEGKVTVFLRFLSDGTAVHVGPLTVRAAWLVTEVRRLLDEVVKGG